MIREDRDPGFWNPIANHPEVRPWVGGDGELDLTAVLERPDVYPLAGEGGGFVFVRISPMRYELHTLFMPGARGANVLEAFSGASAAMFATTDAVEIVTKAADDNRAAQFMACRAGFQSWFTLRSGTRHYMLTLEAWGAKSEHALAEGQAFHDLIEAAKRETGSTLPIHEDDDAHDRAAGAAVMMLKGRQTVKGVAFYNRWAAFAGYEPVELLSEEPPTVDIRDAVIVVRDDALEVLECRLQQ